MVSFRFVRTLGKPVKRGSGHLALALLAVFSLSGCGTLPGWLPAFGPSREQVQDTDNTDRMDGIHLVDVSDAVARKLADSKKLKPFTDVFPNKGANGYLVGPGDIIEISIWETPPAVLFSSQTLDAKTGLATTQAVTFPDQMVAADGGITIPFAGRVPVKGRTTQEIEQTIAKHLKGKANHPQVLVSLVKNNTSNVTVVGDVTASTQMPLTPKGERLLDALAAAGGTKQSTNLMTLQLSRANVTATMPLDSVIRDPKQNVFLRPGDVVTALSQSQSFSVLGATGKNQEIPFEANGISLAQALARSGGLSNNVADARGVFIFRFEDAKLLDAKDATPEMVNGTVPVVYEINLRDPAAFFVTQDFPVQNHDVIYVASSPQAEFQKFLQMLLSATLPAVTFYEATKP